MYRYEKIRFFYDSSVKNLYVLFLRHVKTVIRLELNDAYRCLLAVRNRIYKVYNNIISSLPGFITRQFFDRQEKNNRFIWFNEISRTNKKIELLTFRKTEKRLKKILNQLSIFMMTVIEMD